MKVNCAVITVSDTRNRETDKSGKRIIDLLKDSSHQINMYDITTDDKREIQQSIEAIIERDDVDAVIVNGGTGIAYRDVTIESVQPLFDKELPGFGELFRHLSYQYDIGTASILSRATCGIANHRVIFCLPGSTSAVTLAMEKIILPEIGHMVMELKKDLHN
ncbi:MogA/MoaB family molybdenum cofactor biosynthesis protein [Oceanobacillus bengalensis]|nr:MogA/MoaB family molybdenum cofactor biosynthesis protein [Oceanobacillus bengalensis]